MKNIHFMNSENRDARVNISSLMYKPSHRMGLVGKDVTFMRFLAAGEQCTHDHLLELAEDYGQELVDGDPEIDMEIVGRKISHTETVYLDASGEVRYAPPKIMEVLIDAGGEETERREPVDVNSNVDDELPVRWTGKKIPKTDAVKRFQFARTIQLSHVDGLTYDYLFSMAKQLHDDKAMVLVGGGKKGRDPLIFQVNGTPYRAFLEGRVNEDKYKLLLHLSNLELKLPVAKEK